MREGLFSKYAGKIRPFSALPVEVQHNRPKLQNSNSKIQIIDIFVAELSRLGGTGKNFAQIHPAQGGGRTEAQQRTHTAAALIHKNARQHDCLSCLPTAAPASLPSVHTPTAAHARHPSACRTAPRAAVYSAGSPSNLGTRITREGSMATRRSAVAGTRQCSTISSVRRPCSCRRQAHT